MGIHFKRFPRSSGTSILIPYTTYEQYQLVTFYNFYCNYIVVLLVVFTFMRNETMRNCKGRIESTTSVRL